MKVRFLCIQGSKALVNAETYKMSLAALVDITKKKKGEYVCFLWLCNRECLGAVFFMTISTMNVNPISLGCLEIPPSFSQGMVCRWGTLPPFMNFRYIILEVFFTWKWDY